jgi:glycogen debranching enzyme
MSHVDIGRAKSEIDSLIANATEDGFVAHVTFWQRERYEEMLKTYAISYRTPYLSDCMQPPVLAEAVGAVVKQGAGTAWLRGVLPKVRALYDWLDRERDPDRDGLIAILQPDESGLDHAPKYDGALKLEGTVTHASHTAGWERVAAAHKAVKRDSKGMFAHDTFVVEDVLVNVIYAESLRVLSDLLRQVGDEAGARDFAERAAHTGRSLIEKCWDDDAGLFWDLSGAREERLRVSTVSSLMPLMLPELPESMAKRLAAHLEDPADYGTPFPVPTVSLKEPTYTPGYFDKLVWRGPTWINTNWYVARGLRRHGRADLATMIEDRSVDLVEKSGFREYYDPGTGEGFGAEHFSWSALVLDMLASRDGAG